MAYSVEEEIHLHVLQVRATEVFHADLEIDGIVAGRQATAGTELHDADIVAVIEMAALVSRPGRTSHIDQMHLDPGIVQLLDFLPQGFPFLGPVHRPQVGQNVDDPGQVRVGTGLIALLLRFLQTMHQAVPNRRDFRLLGERGPYRFQQLRGDPPRSALARRVRREQLRQITQAVQTQGLGGRGFQSGWQDFFRQMLTGQGINILGALRIAARFAHARSVVQQHDMERRSGLFAGERVPTQKTGKQQANQQHQQAAQKQQDELLNDQLPPHPLLGLEQKLHRRPADPPETHPIDQMDDDRRADQSRPDHHGHRMEKQRPHSIASRFRLFRPVRGGTTRSVRTVICSVRPSREGKPGEPRSDRARHNEPGRHSPSLFSGGSSQG
jgi:hypothetical protein